MFLLCIVPYSLNIVNLWTYPTYLDGQREHIRHTSQIFKTLRSSLSQSLRPGRLRRLIIESMCYEGLYQSSKDYIQPLLKSVCLSLPILLAMAERQRVALLVGLVYFVLNLLGGAASR
ncbi:MAG: hypothetical protein JXM70_23035, partial [Pirellulales bacterium]|nr:hypothetical protein [Pirellulales bacterium]